MIFDKLLGGTTLYIESTLADGVMKEGKGRLETTGRLGETMSGMLFGGPWLDVGGPHIMTCTLHAYNRERQDCLHVHEELPPLKGPEQQLFQSMPVLAVYLALTCLVINSGFSYLHGKYMEKGMISLRGN